MAQKQNRIGKFSMIAMVTAAMIFDLIEAGLGFLAIGLVLNRLIVVVKWFLFWFWFKIKDVHFTKLNSKSASRRAVTAISTFLIGMIPILGILPEFTIGIIAMLLLVRVEDKTGISAEKTESATRTLNRERLKIQKRKAA